ncbi:amino acid ABC transporter permease [Pseudarthrobacter sp. NBSH8]|uniref:amino acid ABC transporter permease n=1 Tax=Pseudarthrobacter sp. NBSH8 TaxID=2596911 RepID=UPI001628B4B3|nr:amino acid ABC transporter permease [Pseudarthrobacter sp. NBSH8]QNE15271.1 amino acid ABC transporter permease [Pseudarthrobacter sp. NBSH8]
MTSVLYDVPGPKARRISLIGSVVGSVLILGLIAWIVMTLAQQGIFEGRRWAIFTRADVWSLLGNGVMSTLSAAAIAAIIAFPLGLMLSLLRISLVAWIRIPARVVLEFLRGMPVVLMMFFVLLVFGTSSFIAVVAGLVLYNAAIFAEIIRAGIQSLPKGQREAGLTIGLTSFQSRMLIELPQAVRRMMPSLVAQLVVLLKDTSLGYIVAYGELLRAVQVMADFLGTAFLFPIFFVAAAIYIAINISVSRIAVWIERRGSSKAAGGVAKVPTAVVAPELPDVREPK